MPSKEPRDPLDQAFGLLGDEDSWIERLRAAERKDQGLLLGRFEAVEEVGRGGQGIVYKAREGPGGRLVALKRLAAGSFASERARLRFEREVEAATMLAHGNIVSVFGIESAGGQPLLVMEWIDGVDIVSHCRDPKTTRRPLGEIIGLFLDVCAGVIHAHQRGVIHRDLKPKNVLVDGEGRPKILDFGLAAWTENERREGPRLTETREFVGTPAYAAPEQLRGERASIDVRADVYAMGVILFEMLTGELPYGPATSLAGVLLAIEQQEPRAASMLDPRLDREIDAILGKALAKSREARYPSVEALAADLRRHQLGEPVLAHPPSRWYKLRKHLARHPISSGLAAALLLCVLTFGVVSWVQARRIGEERNLAVKATESEALARSEAERAEKAARDALREATVERGRAIRSADKAGAVLAFLLDDMLGTAHPERRGAGTKVIEAMDAALGRIRGRLDGEPEVEAAVRSVAGELYLALGQNEKAGPELEQALALRDLLPGVPAADLVASLIALGNLRISSSECDRALPLLERAVALSEEDEAGSPGVLAAAVNALGTCLSSKGRYGEAEAAFHRALDLYADSASKPGQGSVSVLRGLAEVKLRKGDFGAADRISRQVLRGTIDTLGRESLEAAADMVMRGDLLHELGKYKESEDTFREALAVHRKILGSLHPHIAQDLLKIGVSLTSVGDYDGAGACFEEALEIECRVLGPAAAEAGESVGMLAMTLAAKNRLAEAVAIVERSLSRVKCLLGEEHPVIPNLMTNLATFVHQKGDVERGKALVEEALAMRKRLLGPRHPHIAHTLNAKGVILKVEGDDAGALAAYTEALDILKDSYGGDDHPLMIIVLNNLGTLKLDLEETEAALSYFREAYRISKEAGLPDAQEDVDRARFGFVSSLLRSKEFAEAETVMREIVEACRKAFPENDRHLLGAESLLANALVGVGKYDEAEALLCRLWERISGIDDTTDAERQGVILKLVMLYEHWGRGDAALKWRAKLPAAESRRGGRSGE